MKPNKKYSIRKKKEKKKRKRSHPGMGSFLVKPI
jgi:hypothetical protein